MHYFTSTLYLFPCGRRRTSNYWYERRHPVLHAIILPSSFPLSLSFSLFLSLSLSPALSVSSMTNHTPSLQTLLPPTHSTHTIAPNYSFQIFEISIFVEVIDFSQFVRPLCFQFLYVLCTLCTYIGCRIAGDGQGRSADPIVFLLWTLSGHYPYRPIFTGQSLSQLSPKVLRTLRHCP